MTDGHAEESEQTSYDRFTELAPAEWFRPDTGDRTVWLRIYDAPGVHLPVPEGSKATIDFDLTDNVKVILRPSGFSYPERPVIQQAGEGFGAASEIGRLATLPDATYAVLMTPWVDTPAGELEAIRRLDLAAAVCAAVLSPRVVFRKISEHGEWLDSSRCKVMSDAFKNPAQFREPEISKERVALVRRACTAADALEPRTRNRCQLALRWYLQALSESRVDSFLKVWIAIECLAQMGNSDWTKLAKLLAREYGEPQENVAKRLDLAELAQLRHDIFHSGATPEIHGRLLLVAFAIFEDVLIFTLQLPTERRADAARRSVAFSVRALAPRAP